MTKFLLPLIITIIVEFLISLFFIKNNRKRILGYFILINSFTLPLFTYFYLNIFSNFWFTEALVFITESLLIMVLAEIKFRKAILISFCCNFTTALIALIFFTFSSNRFFLAYKNYKHKVESIYYELPLIREKKKILCYQIGSENYYFANEGLVWYHYNAEGCTFNGEGRTGADILQHYNADECTFNGEGGIKLENSDPASFECIDRNYAKDKNNVYYWGVKVEKADPLTFEPLD